MTSGTRKILIVDDDRDFVEAVSAFLEAHGYEVLKVRDGKEGLKLAHPDPTIMDIVMNERTEGFFTVQEIRRTEELKTVPIFVLSSHYSQVTDFGIPPGSGWLAHDEFLTKPVDLPELLASLPAADFCHSATVFAALRAPGQYGYYLGDDIVVRSNGSWQSVPAAEYRSLTDERAVLGSHAKHSSLNGRPFMAGALARVSINREGLSAGAATALQKLGLTLPSDNPMDNNKAQAVELVHDVECALTLVGRLLEEGLKEERYVSVRPRAGTGTAVTEALRGLLIHSYTYDDTGKMLAADVITPTALNAASIEDHLRRTVEQNPDEDVPALKKKLEMVARAYDPCISCSVHLLQRHYAA